MSKNLVTLGARVPADLADRIKASAEKDRRSISAQLRVLVEEALKAREVTGG